MRRFLFVLGFFLLPFVCPVQALALPDAEVQALAAADSGFAAAEKRIVDCWRNLPADFKKNIKDEQIQWINVGRDREAQELMDRGSTKAQAYTDVTNRRTDYLEAKAQGKEPPVYEAASSDEKSSPPADENARPLPPPHTRVRADSRKAPAIPMPEIPKPMAPSTFGAVSAGNPATVYAMSNVFRREINGTTYIVDSNGSQINGTILIDNEEVPYRNGLMDGVGKVYLEDRSDPPGEIYYRKGVKYLTRKSMEGGGIIPTFIQEEQWNGDVQHGLSKWYEPERQSMAVTKYDNGKRVSYLRYNTETGKVTSESTYDKNGKQSGPEYDYRDNGDIWHMRTWNNGELDGPKRYFYKNGRLKNEYLLRDNKYVGVASEYTRDGYRVKETVYEDGAEVLEKLYDVGSDVPWKITELKDGKKDGKEEVFYDNGDLKRLTIYKDGEEVESKDFERVKSMIPELELLDSLCAMMGAVAGNKNIKSELLYPEADTGSLAEMECRREEADSKYRLVKLEAKHREAVKGCLDEVAYSKMEECVMKAIGGGN
ncbi:hypothetical protein C4J81_17815 [Deltaproteobacteria bacterium Smac51]|nr:hypothetical protein C4J81_17815 [Deltaproteobacteria bacterium Smac51]